MLTLQFVSPKVTNDITVSQYRPIALANFKFKIISKILDDRLAPVMKNIISVEQRGFIQGRNIKDYICDTSKAIKQLHNKSFADNLAFKVDMAKAFDTLEWSFLLKVLKRFVSILTFVLGLTLYCILLLYQFLLLARKMVTSSV